MVHPRLVKNLPAWSTTSRVPSTELIFKVLHAEYCKLLMFSDYHALPPQRHLKPDGPNSKRYSLPSTHILFGRAKNRGSANIEEHEKLTKMIQAAADDDVEYSGNEIVQEPVTLSIDVKVIGPLDNENFGYFRAHIGYMKEFFASTMRSSGAAAVTWNKTGMMPRAVYEKQMYVIEAHIVLSPRLDVADTNELFSEFATQFTSKTMCMLQDQAFLEVPKLNGIFPKIT